MADTTSDPLDPANIVATLEKILGISVQSVPIVGTLISLATDPSIATVLSVSSKNLYAELTAHFDAMRKLSPAARAVLFDGMTPAMRNQVMDADRRAIERVQLDQDLLAAALPRVGNKILEELIRLLAHA